MAFWFPGWPGSILTGGRSNIANVGMPALPAWPGYPGMPAGSGLPGGPGMPSGPGVPAGSGLPGGPGMPGGAAFPGAAAAPPPGPPPGPPSPLAGLAQYGVPVVHSPTGRPVIRAGANGAMVLPPEIPGMPTMPGPPNGFLGGGQQAGGLFRPMAPVAPFDPGNQVRNLEQQR